MGGLFTSHDPSIEVSPGRVWVWFFCGHYIPCIFRVYSRVSSSSDVFEYDARETLSRARSNREITRDPRWPGRDGIVVGHDSSFRGQRTASSSLDRSLDRSTDRSDARAGRDGFLFIHSRAATCDGGVGTRARARGDETCDDDDASDDDGSTRGGLEDARATRGGGRVGVGVGRVGGGGEGGGAGRDEG